MHMLVSCLTACLRAGRCGQWSAESPSTATALGDVVVPPVEQSSASGVEPLNHSAVVPSHNLSAGESVPPRLTGDLDHLLTPDTHSCLEPCTRLQRSGHHRRSHSKRTQSEDTQAPAPFYIQCHMTTYDVPARGDVARDATAGRKSLAEQRNSSISSGCKHDLENNGHQHSNASCDGITDEDCTHTQTLWEVAQESAKTESSELRLATGADASPHTCGRLQKSTNPSERTHGGRTISVKDSRAWQTPCRRGCSRQRSTEGDDGLAAGINGLLSSQSRRLCTSSPRVSSSPLSTHNKSYSHCRGTLVNVTNAMKNWDIVQYDGTVSLAKQAPKQCHRPKPKVSSKHFLASDLKVTTRTPSYAGMTCSASHKRKLVPK
eukprot:jgi/Ulvmu1/1510/UM011_0240.1